MSSSPGALFCVLCLSVFLTSSAVYGDKSYGIEGCGTSGKHDSSDKSIVTFVEYCQIVRLSCNLFKFFGFI